MTISWHIVTGLCITYTGAISPSGRPVFCHPETSGTLPLVGGVLFGFFWHLPRLSGNSTQMFLSVFWVCSGPEFRAWTYAFTSPLVDPNMLMTFPGFSVGNEDFSQTRAAPLPPSAGCLVPWCPLERLA